MKTISERYPESGFNGYYYDSPMSYSVYLWIKALQDENKDLEAQLILTQEVNREQAKELNQQRFNNSHNLSIDQQVSDRIKELEAKLAEAELCASVEAREADKAREKLKVAVEALKYVANYDCDGFVENYAFATSHAKKALKKLEGV